MRRALSEYLSHTALYFLSLAYTAAVCVNLFGCVFYFTARVEGIADGNTWLSAVGAQSNLVTWSSLPLSLSPHLTPSNYELIQPAHLSDDEWWS